MSIDDIENFKPIIELLLKTEKYGDLQIELEHLWNIKTFVIPIACNWLSLLCAKAV